MRLIFGGLGTCTALVLGNIAGASEEDVFVDIKPDFCFLS